MAKKTNTILKILEVNGKPMRHEEIYRALTPNGFRMTSEMKLKVYKSLMYLLEKGAIGYWRDPKNLGPTAPVVLPHWLTPNGNLKSKYK